MDILIGGQHLDLKSLGIGAVAVRSLEEALVQAVKRLPGLAVALLKKRVLALATNGKINAPTMSLLKVYASATFDWVDAELPNAAGDAKMDAALDRLAALPYIGVLVRADRAGAKEILQAAYDAVDEEAKAEAAALKANAPAPEAPTVVPPPAPPVAKPNPDAANSQP